MIYWEVVIIINNKVIDWAYGSNLNEIWDYWFKNKITGSSAVFHKF